MLRQNEEPTFLISSPAHPDESVRQPNAILMRTGSDFIYTRKNQEYVPLFREESKTGILSKERYAFRRVTVRLIKIVFVINN